MKIAIALGLFGSLILLLNQPTASAYLSDSSDIEDPSSLNGESVISVAGNDISILRKKKKNRPAKKQKKAKKSKVPAEPRCSASSPNKPQIIGNMTQRIRPISTPNGRFLRQRCGWHFEPEQGRKLSLKCRIGKNALRNCKKTYLTVNGKKYCGKLSKIEIQKTSYLSLKFRAKITGRSKISCIVVATEEPVLKCPDQWEKNGTFCYLAVEEYKSWDNASIACQQRNGSQLASVHDQNENDFLKDLSDRAVWLGGKGSSSSGIWSWTDKSDFSFTNWDSDNGKPDKGREACIVMDGGVGKWRDAASYNVNYFVCKLKLGGA